MEKILVMEFVPQKEAFKTSHTFIEYQEKQRAFSFNDVFNLFKHSGFSKIDWYKDLDGNIATDEKFGVYVCAK